MDIFLVTNEPCIICGKYGAVDIDGGEWPHRCKDYILRWIDGTLVKSPKEQSA